MDALTRKQIISFVLAQNPNTENAYSILRLIAEGMRVVKQVSLTAQELEHIASGIVQTSLTQ